LSAVLNQPPDRWLAAKSADEKPCCGVGLNPSGGRRSRSQAKPRPENSTGPVCGMAQAPRVRSVTISLLHGPAFDSLETEAAISKVPAILRQCRTALGIRVGCVYLCRRPIGYRRQVPQHEETTVRHRTLVRGGVLVLGLGLGGCGADSPATLLTPSPLPPQAVVPAPAPSPSFPDGTLKGVSLSGVVYELTQTGRRPIAAAVLL
jgi:hypothetical protein